MDTMRRLFVVLGFLMVVGFLGVELARDNSAARIADAGTEYNAGSFSKDPEGKPTTQPTPAYQPSVGSTTALIDKGSELDLSGCERIQQTAIKPRFKKDWKEIPIGEYVLVADPDSRLEQPFGNYSRQIAACGNFPGGTEGWTPSNNDYHLHGKTPLPDKPYGLALAWVGKDAIPQPLCPGVRFALKKPTVVAIGDNRFPEEWRYTNGDYLAGPNLRIDVYKCANK